VKIGSFYLYVDAWEGCIKSFIYTRGELVTWVSDLTLLSEYIEKKSHKNTVRKCKATPDISNTTLFFATLGALLDHLLSLGVDLLVEDLTGGLALLALRRLRLHADGVSSTAADLLLGVLPRCGTVVNCVSGG
jgi:hypothetical protein